MTHVHIVFEGFTQLGQTQLGQLFEVQPYDHKAQIRPHEPSNASEFQVNGER